MRRWMLVLMVGLAALAAAGAKRPNIVWLVSEDNSASWLKLYNENGISMPSVERLAENGLVFNHAFSCAPVCSVARSTIISGCYAVRTGSQFHRAQLDVPMPDDIRMFPYYLREAGYYTSNCAKEDYNFTDADKEGVWDDSSKKASYRNRRPGQPFFHVQNYGITHESQLHFKNMKQPTKTDPGHMDVAACHPDTETFRYTYARYYDRHRQLDAKLGQFIQMLEQDGLLDDTFIFYYGDHGGVLPGSKGYAYNRGLQVPLVVHVPKNWKHLAPAQPGARIDGFVEFVDLSATVLNLADARIPAGLDGRPFLGKQVKLDELNRRDTTFGYADRFDEKYDLVRTLRKGRYIYVRSYQPFNPDALHNAYRYRMLAYQEWRRLFQDGALNAAQRRFFEARPPELLFDLSTDPDEVNNLAADPAYAATLKTMRTELCERVKSMPDLSFIPEPALLKEGGSNPVQYGRQKKAEIARLVDLADLTLKPFAEAKPLIAQALASEHRWERYWGLVVCSSYGQQAAAFYEQAAGLAESDAERLVRVRAAEFLGLTGQRDPRPIFQTVLREVSDPIEAGLILNSAALLHEAFPEQPFDLSEFKGAAWAKKAKSAPGLRVNYLSR